MRRIPFVLAVGSGILLAGTVTVTSKGVVSRDGKTLTITQTGTDAQGRTVNTIGEYDKQ